MAATPEDGAAILTSVGDGTFNLTYAFTASASFGSKNDQPGIWVSYGYGLGDGSSSHLESDAFVNEFILGPIPPGLRQFVAMAVGESGDGLNSQEIKAIASSMINRINKANSSLWDPNWIKKTSYGGNPLTNYVVLKDKNPKHDYLQIMGMSMSAILKSHNSGIQAALSAYENWDTDYSNPQGYDETGEYYWNKTSVLFNKGTVYNPNNYIITLQAGGSTFYRRK